MSVLYEKGSPEWDIGIVNTRHGDGTTRNQNGEVAICARRQSTLDTAGSATLDARQRLTMALATVCDCGAGDSSAEKTSLR